MSDKGFCIFADEDGNCECHGDVEFYEDIIENSDVTCDECHEVMSPGEIKIDDQTRLSFCKKCWQKTFGG